MEPIVVYLTGILLAGAVALAVVRFLRQPLHRILVDLCGTEDRAAFWTAFSAVTLVLVPLVGAMMHRPRVSTDWDMLFEIAVQLRFAFVGLVFATMALGFVISRFIPRDALTSARAPTMPRPNDGTGAMQG